MTNTPSSELGKVGPGNHRTGVARNRRTHVGRNKGALPWRKDPLILERVDLVRILKAQGHTGRTMLPRLNEIMVSHGQPEITIDTVYNDFERLREIQAEERARAIQDEQSIVGEHIEALTEVRRQAWKAFEQTPDKSLNRSAYLNTIRATVETTAKLDGSLIHREGRQVDGNVRVVVEFVTDWDRVADVVTVEDTKAID